MTDARKPAPRHTKAAFLLLVLIAIAVTTGLHFQAWLWAWWVFPDVPEQHRTASLYGALAGRGVAARLEQGRMVRLGKDDVAEVGPSHCVRETECTAGSTGRRHFCREVLVTFTCGYDVKDRQGNPATAILEIRSNPAYRVGVDQPGSPRPFVVGGALELNRADDKLCELGYGCRAAGSPEEPSEASPPPPVDAAAGEFQDCAGAICAPVMVTLPQGTYLAGGERGEFGSGRSVEVEIGYRLAVGKFEVTFAEWDACVADGGCKRKPDDETWGRGRRPVINVSWDDVTGQYLPWLNRKLGLSGAGAYRLPTGQEWEYAARAVTSGTTPRTRYAWGNEIGTNRANCRTCGSEWDGWKTAPVGSFAPNGFGLHDMHGNVEEWIEECEPSSRSTAGAPPDSRHCFHRGGSWNESPDRIRSAFRLSTFSSGQSRERGFRLVRTMDPL